jgi:hypothetical protein
MVEFQIIDKSESLIRTRHWHLEKTWLKVLGLCIRYIPKPSPRPNTYTILGTLPKHV